MKKLIIALCLSFISTFCYSQDWEKIRLVNIIEYKNNKWTDGESHYPDNYYIKLNGSEIIVKSKELSTYMTYGTPDESKYDTHIAYSWKAIDDKGDNCTFIMKKFYDDGTTIYMITYRNIGVEFYLK
jgi:hypothetical protein